MKKLCWGLWQLFFYATMQGSAYIELADRRYNEVCTVWSHNGCAVGPSVVNNQLISFVEQMNRGVRGSKLAIHYEQDFGGGVGNNPMVCHGAYRSVIYKDYYGMIIGSILKDLVSFIETIKPYIGPAKDISIPGAYIKVGDIPFLLKMYAEQLKPVAAMVQGALPVVYGHDSVADSAKVPYNPCVIDVAARPLIAVLAEIKEFLIANPKEIFTVRLELKVPIKEIVDALKSIGLDEYVHIQDKTKAWPTINEMVKSGKRLVLFMNKGFEPEYPFLHNSDDYFISTDYSFSSAVALAQNRKLIENTMFAERFKEPRNKVFEVSHFLTLGLAGLPRAADKVNKRDFLRKRIKALMTYAGMVPTGLTLDFVERPNGDSFEVADEVNGIGKYKGKPLMDSKDDGSFFGKVAATAQELEDKAKQAFGQVATAVKSGVDTDAK